MTSVTPDDLLQIRRDEPNLPYTAEVAESNFNDSDEQSQGVSGSYRAGPKPDPDAPEQDGPPTEKPLKTSPPFDFFAFRRKLSPVAYEIPQEKNFFLPSHDWSGVLITDDGQFLGAGAFGEVYKGKWVNIPKPLPTPPPVAIKIIKISTHDEADTQMSIMQNMRDEIYVWQSVKHDNVVPLIGVTAVRTSLLPAIVSQWMPNGTIKSYMKKNSAVDKLELLKGIARGLNALHSCKPSIVHGDLKPENVLVDERGSPRLADFGLSRILEDTSLSLSSADSPGTIPYMAPELLGEHPPKLDVSTDMYAYGVTAWQILSGSEPYPQFKGGIARIPQIMMAVLSDNARPERKPREAFSDRMWELLTVCWDREPTKRRDTQVVLRALFTLERVQ